MASMALLLRAASNDDLPAIVALMNAAFRGGGERRGWSTESAYITGNRTEKSLLHADLREHVQLFVIDNQQTANLDGCVSLQPISPEKWYLGSLAVHPAQQNSGLGRRLLDASERYLASQGASFVEITVVNVRDALISWYERRGYRQTGEIRPFPYGDTRFGTPLRPDLAFVVLEKPLPKQPSDS